MKRQQQSLGILILTFIIVVTWVAVHFYELYKTSTISSTLQVQITPITPSFDQTTLTALSKRKTVTPLYVQTQTGSSSAVILTPAPQFLVPTVTEVTPIQAPPLIIPQGATTLPSGSTGGVLK